MVYEKMFPPQCGMSGEPLDSCGIQWSRETPQKPAPGDEEAHGPPRHPAESKWIAAHRTPQPKVFSG